MGRTYQPYRFSITKPQSGKHHKYTYCFRGFWIHHKQCSVPIQSNCSVQRDAASLIAPDTIKANKLQFAHMNLTYELYARKLRKEIYEQKGTLSNVSFFKGTIYKFKRIYRRTRNGIKNN
jgi:hypothetical protein